MSEAGIAPTAATRERAGLRVAPVWLVLGLLAVATLLYLDELAALVERWSASEGDSHGFLIAAAVPVLVWLRRHELGWDAGSRLLPALGCIALTAAWLLARAASVDLAHWLVLAPLVWCACWLALGWRSARVLAFPIGYFLFAVPVWNFLVPLFQWLTVQACTVLLAAIGTRAYIQEVFVTVPAGSFEIAGGCSGMNFVVVALATATLFAWLERLRLRRAAALVAIGLGFAVVANWVRVTIVIYTGDVTAMQSSLVEDHYTFGWYVFAVAMVPFFFVARRIARGAPLPPAPPARPPVPATTAARGLLLGVLALAVGPVWAAGLDRQAARAPAPALVLPALPGWLGPVAPSFEWEPSFPGAAASQLAGYQQGALAVDAFAAFYGLQAPGEKLIGYWSSVAGEGWTERELTVRTLATPDGAPLAVREHVLERPGGARVVWSWYEVRGARTTRALEVKAREALRALGLPARSGVVALSAACEPDCAAARGSLEAAWRAGLAGASAGTGR